METRTTEIITDSAYQQGHEAGCSVSMQEPPRIFPGNPFQPNTVEADAWERG